MSGKSELLTLTPLISARFYLRRGFFDPDLSDARFHRNVKLGRMFRARSNAETGHQVKSIRGMPSTLLRRTWKQFSFPKPVLEESAPLADGGISQIEADAVRRVFKNVEFRRNAGFAQRQIERHAIFGRQDRKSTRLNSSHRCISYAVF